MQKWWLILQDFIGAIRINHKTAVFDNDNEVTFLRFIYILKNCDPFAISNYFFSPNISVDSRIFADFVVKFFEKVFLNPSKFEKRDIINTGEY